MKSNYRRLGDCIRQIKKKNTDGKCDELLGINIDKFFMPSVANVVGTDLTKYKVVEKNQFACNRMHVGRDYRIPIALSKQEQPFIVSPAYTVFEIIEDANLEPEYLMMWFSRSEFDREAWYHTDADVRGGLPWDLFCDIELPVPSIEKQREIVAEYNTVTNRIKLNEQLNQKLEETAQALYKHWFVDFNFPITKESCPELVSGSPELEGKPYKSSGGEMVWCDELDGEVPVGWVAAPLSDFGKVVTGKTPSSNNPEDFGDEMFFITPGDFKFYNKFALSSERKLSKSGFNRLSNKILSRGAIIVTCIGSDMGKIVVANYDCITNQQMNSIIAFEKYYSDYLYHHLTFISDEIKVIAMGSSTMPMLNKTDFEKVLLIRPINELLQVFDKVVKPINDKLINLSIQNEKLTVLQSLLLSKISKVEDEKEMDSKKIN